MTIFNRRNKSPYPPEAVGSPFPLSRSLASALLPGGIFTRTGSVSVGAMTSAPSAASHGQIGRVTLRSVPCSRNTPLLLI